MKRLLRALRSQLTLTNAVQAAAALCTYVGVKWVGEKAAAGFLLAGAGELLWLIYALRTRAWFLAVLALVFVHRYAENARLWMAP